MPEPFAGFPPGKTRLVRLPGAFFTDLLPLIDDADELKLTLFCFWALERREGDYRYLRCADFAAPQCPLPDSARREAALQAAVARGTLLTAQVESVNGLEALYFLNTAKGREALRLIGRGYWRPGDADNPVEILPDRPGIYELYEENIGALTPLIADELRDAEQTYPEGWLRDAIKVAVLRNARSWRYVMAVLERWYKEGRDDGPGQTADSAGPDSEQHRRRYVSGKFADIIES